VTAFDLPGLRHHLSAVALVTGYQDYQNSGCKKYGSACSLWHTVLLEKGVLPNLEVYGGLDEIETAKTASMILSGLLFFLLASPAHAQHLDWRRVTADARAARQTGNNTGAVTLYKQALEIQEKTFGPKSREVATSLHNLAVLYQDESKDAEAEPLYRRSIAIWGEYPGTDKLIAASLSNLAALCHDEHKDEEAEQLFNRSLAV